jgi:hypothetical protein
VVGHLWQGRFRSKPILKDIYLVQCAAYIEANPVRAGLVKTIAEYTWSSYNERCFSTKKRYLDEMRIDNRKDLEGTALILKQETFLSSTLYLSLP